MSWQTLLKVVGTICFLAHMRLPIDAQSMTGSPFRYTQLGFLDSVGGESTLTGIVYPAAAVELKSGAVLSVGKMLEVSGWNQLTGCFFSKKKSTGIGVHFSVEKLATSSQMRTGIQVARVLQNELSIGLIMGVSSVAVTGYKKELQPFSKLGLQTKLSDQLTASFALTIESQPGFLLQKSKSLYTSILAGTQLNVSTAVTAVLHLQKTMNAPLEWMAFLSYFPAAKFRFQLGFSPNPQWWMLRASFLLNQFTVQIGLGVQPLVGTLSHLSFQLPTPIK
ncbi:MAG: hypothetical protein EB047_02595 [Chitinophagaceae bacterium]|nr:hypothetical protein [Chitinophagaceae bacterium]